jgi:methylthioribose-1-phosphate isomerase
MEFATIYWQDERVYLIDQTLLPNNEKIISTNDYHELAEWIKELKVRGAPAIGVAGALGMALAAIYSSANSKDELFDELVKARGVLSSTRPTAVNLFWALDKIWSEIMHLRDEEMFRIRLGVVTKALSIWQEDRMICMRIGKHAATLFNDGDTVLTHCNAGSLATVMYGTALSGIYEAVSQGKKISVYADETRPLLQGARLTSWELNKSGVPVTVICDNMAASLMAKGKINKVIVGADRIANNGDVANKIGTLSVAINAKYFGIDFYVAAPMSTFDFNIIEGSMIPIEERDRSEVAMFNGIKIVPDDVPVYNPAFDVTPAKLVTAWISEKGIAMKVKDIRNWR